MKQDYSIFEKVPVQELINNDTLYSDPDTEKSDKEDEQFLSDEEYTNKYCFLESFKNRKKYKKCIKKVQAKISSPPVVKKEVYDSD